MFKITATIAFIIFIICGVYTSFIYADPSENKGKKAKVQVEEQGRGKNNDHKESEGATLTLGDIRFEDIRRIAIANHCIGYESLPPGIRKNLARGKAIPPGIAKKAVPSPVLRELPKYEGYEWRVYGWDLVLVSIATEIIERVISDVFQ